MSSLIQHNQPAWIEDYIDSPEKQRRLYKRTLIIVVLSQIFGGAGLAAGIAVGALLAQEMLGTDSFAGVPIALFTLGSAGAALVVGQLSQRFGRRIGLAAGFLAGGFGAVGIIVAAVIDHVPLLFLSLVIYGAGTATNLQARYAGTDLANAKQRATAVSIALVATTFGAVAGPNLIEVMGEFALSIGVPALAGPFILAAASFILAGLVLLALLRPDPYILAKAIAERQQIDEGNLTNAESEPMVNRNRGIMVGAVIMVLTQMVMIAIMTMTPVHMGHHGHSMNQVGLVISLHIGAMFLPSLLTGYLVDKVGRTAMAIASGATLLASGILAAVAPPESMLGLTIALILLGLGWNFGLISGTALIVDATTPFNRAKIQGSVDVSVALSGAAGGAMSGIVVAHTSFMFLSYAGGFLALLLIPVVVWANRSAKEETKDANRMNA
ncbi:MFS transporter [Alkalihalophilus lindianensis]|uniref:MFS transporter n=1 Tax=Alkalihalophilus lindianensis TaxID=1630542 RepID=A0ABU3XEN2_9BACI|nr:MFS transporter [Alkalihalophilus lindianensis]MDV2686072.1 MFS transporter [Alkalihalophilus lindianensis]